MNCVQNFLLVAREDATSPIEKIGDFLLTPARMLMGGRKVIVFPDSSAHVTDQGVCSSPGESVEKTALKVAIAIGLSPFAGLGAIIKLCCFFSENYRKFCAQEIPKTSNCHPKLFEMFQHVHSTADFVSEDFVEGMESEDSESEALQPWESRPGRNYRELFFKPLHLSECSCEATGAFHRLKSPRRNRLENAIVRRLVETRVDKSAPLRLLSMGSGGLMSDFITLEKLVLAGFTNIEMDCVEPEGISARSIQKIKDFFGEYPGVSLRLTAHKHIDELSEEKNDYSAVLAVDYEVLSDLLWENQAKGLRDLMDARHLLGENGFLALGFGEEDVLCGKEMNPIVLSRTALSQVLIDSLSQNLQKKENLRVMFPFMDFGLVFLWLYAIAIAVEKSPESYRTVSIFFERRERNLKPFSDMISSLFRNADSIEFGLHEEGQKYDLLLTGSLESEVESKTYLDRLNPEAIVHIRHPEGSIYQQIGNREKKLYSK